MLKEFWFAERGGTFFYKAARKMPFPPNFWTLATLVPVLVGFACVWKGWIFLATVFYSVAGVLDVSDGIIARARGQVTPLGAFLDGVVDRFTDFTIAASFVFLPWPRWLIPQDWFVLLLVFFSFMPSFVVAYATHRKVLDDEGAMKWRILPRAERFFLLLAIVFSAIWSGAASLAIAHVTLVLCIATTFQSIVLVVLKGRIRVEARGTRDG